MDEKLTVFDELMAAFEGHSLLFVAANELFQEPRTNKRHDAITMLRRTMTRISERHKELTYLLFLEAEMAVRT